MATWSGLVISEDHCKTYDIYTTEHGLNSNYVNSLEFDHEGNLLVGSSVGLNKINLQNKTISTLLSSNISIRDIEVGESGKIYLGTNTKHMMVSDENMNFVSKSEGLPTIGVNKVLVTSGGEIYLAAHGLFHFNTDTDSFDLVQIPGFPDYFENNSISDLQEGEDGKIYVFDGPSIIRFDENSTNFELVAFASGMGGAFALNGEKILVASKNGMYLYKDKEYIYEIQLPVETDGYQQKRRILFSNNKIYFPTFEGVRFSNKWFDEAEVDPRTPEIYPDAFDEAPGSPNEWGSLDDFKFNYGRHSTGGQDVLVILATNPGETIIKTEIVNEFLRPLDSFIRRDSNNQMWLASLSFFTIDVDPEIKETCNGNPSPVGSFARKEFRNTLAYRKAHRRMVFFTTSECADVASGGQDVNMRGNISMYVYGYVNGHIEFTDIGIHKILYHEFIHGLKYGHNGATDGLLQCLAPDALAFGGACYSGDVKSGFDIMGWAYPGEFSAYARFQQGWLPLEQSLTFFEIDYTNSWTGKLSAIESTDSNLKLIRFSVPEKNLKSESTSYVKYVTVEFNKTHDTLIFRYVKVQPKQFSTITETIAHEAAIGGDFQINLWGLADLSFTRTGDIFDVTITPTP
jgi:hypothetical protein